MAEIRVTISADGRTVKLDVQGVQGAGCSDLTRAIEQALGTVAKSEKKPEYHQTATLAQSLKR